MGSLIEELRRREAAARAEADRLRGWIKELAEDLARAEERVSRLVIAREEVSPRRGWARARRSPVRRLQGHRDASGAVREATPKAAARLGKMRTRLASGEKPNGKRMAALVTVYDAKPANRRPHDVIAAAFDEAEAPRRAAPADMGRPGRRRRAPAQPDPR
jgi:hypothetical protein